MNSLAPAARRSPSLLSARRRGEVSAGCIGCLVVLGILCVLLIVGGLYARANWKGWAAGGVLTAARQVLSESGLPQAEQDQLVGELKLVTDDFKAGKISFQELAKIAESLAESPVVPVTGVIVVDRGYVTKSTLTAEDKAAVNRALQRYARGLAEGTIPMDQQEMERALRPIVVRTDKSRWELRKPEVVTDRDLLDLAANVKAHADAAGVPDEPYTVDLPREFRKAVDKALGRDGSATPQPQPPT